MAEVDQAYQYSVEVKSRFSLFLDDPLSNEDPDILQNRIQNQRQERKKKDKPITTISEPKPVDSFQENEGKVDEAVSKGKNAAGVKQTKPPCAATPVSPGEPANDMPAKIIEEHYESPAPRGRGAPRGFGRGARGRGFGPRAFNEGPPASGDLQAQSREMHFEPRGRGRGRGGFSRGRGSAYVDHREFDRPSGSDRMAPRAGQYREDQQFIEQPVDDESLQAIAPESGDAEHKEIEEGEKHDEELVNGEAEPTEEEPKSYTLEEYKAMRSKPTIALPSKGTRKPNDGKDVFANMVAHRKINEASDDEIEEVEKEPEEEPQFEFNVTFTDRFSDRGRGSYGGRGGPDRGRGAPGFRGTGGRPRSARGTRAGFRGAGRGRGFARGGGIEQHAAPPPIYSDQDFPSLK